MRRILFLVSLQLLILSGCTDSPEITVDMSPLGGRDIYALHCQVCHGADGRGISGNCPPFRGSSRIGAQEREGLLEVVLLGRSGVVERDGHSYLGIMPAWRNKLTDGQIADVMNFIQSSSWGGEWGRFDASEIAAVRQKIVGKPHFSE